MEVSMAGRLETAGLHPLRDRVTIKNLSSHGARVISARSWHEHDHVNLSEMVGDYRLDAQVVYCERLGDSRFAVGLKFWSAAQPQQEPAHRHRPRSYW
jgi:PilZ domain